MCVNGRTIMLIKHLIHMNHSLTEITTRRFFKVLLSPLGASVVEIKHENNMLNMVPASLNDFFKPGMYYGKTIGRVAGRIKNGRASINGRDYFIAMNEGVNALHGGYFGLSDCLFKEHIEQFNDRVEVTYSYKSMDLESGFPGNLDVNIKYTIFEDESVLLVEFVATSDKDTIVNLTNHLFFTLGEENIDNLKLTMNAEKYVFPDDKDFCPLKINDVEDEMFDFRNGLRLSEYVNDERLTGVKAGGYDHQFIIEKENDHLLRLEGNKYLLDISSSYDACIVYSDNIVDNIKVKHTEQPNRRSIALEPQKNQLGDISLKAYDVYKHFIKYEFKRK